MATQTTPRRTRATNSQTEVSDWQVDDDLLDPSYNQVRSPQLPHGLILNQKPAGILIPLDQLEKAEWQPLPTAAQLHTVELSEEVQGLLLQRCRFVVLATAPEYVRYRTDEEKNGDLAGTIVGLYDDYRNRLDKHTMEVCSEHALVFLDKNNRPRHRIPIVVRFRNVALWSFKSAKEEYYRSLEKVFHQYCQQQGLTVKGAPLPYSGKNDRWRSLGVLEITFEAVKEGKGNNRHNCCKTKAITAPTLERFPQLFLGTKAQKALIWSKHDEIAGFLESQDSSELSADRRLLEPASTPTASHQPVDELDDDFVEVNATTVVDDGGLDDEVADDDDLDVIDDGFGDDEFDDEFDNDLDAELDEFD